MRARLPLLLSLLVLQGCTLWGEHPVRNWTDVTGGESLERNFWMEVKTGNWNELERHIADNYMYVGAHGSRSKEQALHYLQGLKLSEYSLGDFQVELHGVTLVVTYTVTLRGSGANGQPLPDTPVRMMGVWEHQKSGWIAIAHSQLVPLAAQ